jgi:hypothetical protein
MRRLLIVLPLLCGACADGQTPAPASAGEGQSASILAQLRTLIGPAACTASSQCHSLPVGARACGGPQAYLPWSSAHTSPASLHALAARYQAARRAQIRARGEISDCRFLIDPGAVCRAGTCQPGDSLPLR